MQEGGEDVASPDKRRLGPSLIVGRLGRKGNTFVFDDFLGRASVAESPNESVTLTILARMHLQQGRYTEAEKAYEEALVLCLQRFGVKHQATALVRSGYESFLRERLGLAEVEVESRPENASKRAAVRQFNAN
jgi:tetratricopeptide (TPR) repeat protein